jgi:hypothetical protein
VVLIASFLIHIVTVGFSAMDIWCIGDWVKVNPVNGKIWEENATFYSKHWTLTNYKISNPVWDKNNNLVRIYGARNEYVAFQIIIENGGTSLSNVNLSSSDLTGPDTIHSNYIELFKEWYVNITSTSANTGLGNGWYPDALVPLSLGSNLLGAPFNIPDSFNGISGQTNQAIWVDIFIPKDISSGDYSGTIKITSSGQPDINLNVLLTVWNFTLSDDLHMIMEMNNYGEVDGKASDMRIKYYRLMQKHRLVLATDDGGIKPGYDSGTGNIDWTNYDSAYAPILSGTAFTSAYNYGVGPLQGKPIKQWHLPFAWNPTVTQYNHYKTNYWPLSYEYKKTNQSDFETKLKKAFVDVESHFVTKGWTNSDLILFLNGLDEPIPPCHIFNKNGSTRCNKYAWCCGDPAFSGAPSKGVPSCSGIVSECRASGDCSEYYDYDHIKYYGNLLKSSGATRIKYDVDIGNFNNVGPLSDGEWTVDTTLNYIGDSVDRWVIASGYSFWGGSPYFNTQKLQNRINNYNEEVLYYGLGEPGSGSVNIDEELIGCTIHAWIVWKYRLQGAEAWEFTYQNSTAWTTPSSGNGGAYFVYLESATIGGQSKNFGQPISTIRLKAFRRGVQDYEYFYNYKIKGQESLVDNVVNSIVSAALDYAFLPPYSGSQIYGPWSHDPIELYNARLTLGSKAPEEQKEILKNVKVYPNPFVLSKSIDKKIKFINLSPTSIIEIYNVNGDFIKTVNVNYVSGNESKAEWDVKNTKGELVPEGIYFYVIKDSSGNNVKGKIGVIK